MNVILIGMMGAGKTSVGERLYEITGRELIDTDAVIERRHGKIAEIFARFGEGYFRGLETELVRELTLEDGKIIATGGGLVTKRESAELLKKCGKIVYLRARSNTLLSRIKEDGTRPLLKGGEGLKERVERLLSERAPIYESIADIIVDTDEKSIEETAGEVINLAYKEEI